MKKLKGFYFETSIENAEISANGFYFKKGRENSTDENHVLSIGIVKNGKVINENWTGFLKNARFTPQFFCNDVTVLS